MNLPYGRILIKMWKDERSIKSLLEYCSDKYCRQDMMDAKINR